MKRVWNEHLDNILRRNYPKGDLDALAQRMGMTIGAIKCRACVLGLKRKVHKREPWTDRQLAYLRKHYADMRAEDIAKKVRHTVGSVWRTASKLGLKKSPEFLAQWGHLVASTEGAKANQFAKGQSPANKGKRIEEFMSEEGIRRSSRTRFKRGHRPHNQRDIGTECVHGDGYVYLRIESGCVLKHRYVWEQANGEVPEGYVVAFRDGNRQNCDLSNLYLLSREDNARRRVSEETPEARKARVAKAQITRNKSIRRDKIRLHWGMEPIGKLVKRW